jgi:hypothetical protein
MRVHGAPPLHEPSTHHTVFGVPAVVAAAAPNKTVRVPDDGMTSGGSGRSVGEACVLVEGERRKRRR